MTNYHVSPPPEQKLKAHWIVGYDPESEKAEYTLEIPISKADVLRRFVRFESGDPEGYDSYKMEYSKIMEMLDLLGHASKPPKRLEYFLEPSP
ncbi:MAG TPA: hypothetical protein VH684_27960 [Xanthobacteraceae bacterium]|jgi:hypothetical protein